MAEIKHYPVVKHLRSEPSMHVVRYRNGAAVESGRGLAFWFHPLSAAVAEIPMDDRELTMQIRGITLDFQEVFVQGVVTWRVVDAEALASRVDFHVDMMSGRWTSEPLEQVSGLLTRMGQEVALAWIAERPLENVLAEGVGALRSRIAEGLAAERSIGEMGIAVVTVRVASVRPTSEVEKALQTPVREAIQTDADRALFQRRALAVEKERSIAEAEMQNRIELSKREELLLGQQGANAKLQAREEAEAARIRMESDAEATGISARAEAERARVSAEAEAEGLRLVEMARAEAEQAMMDVYRDLPPEVLTGLAARDFASKLQRIEHLNIAPDMLGQLVGDFIGAATRRLEA
ncbi:MAG: band 7 protein [Actinobacteria bacterium]|nr:band 7 protein [Actinomycetota bacterium]